MKIFSLILLTSVAAMAQPTITVSPNVGPPARQTTVSGKGFAAAEAVDIYFDTAYLALATTGAAGSFAGVGLEIPANAVPGAHWISGVGRRSGLAAQTTFTVRADWKEFHRGSARQGDNPTENVLNVTNVAGMQLLWLGFNGGGPSSSPVVAGGVTYVPNAGDLFAFDAATGRQVWNAYGLNISTTPAVADGVVYVGATSTDDMLYAFNAATGKELWAADLGASQGSGMLSSPAVADGVIYVGSSAENIYALATATGKVTWQAPIFGEVYAAPAVANGVVYVAAGGVGSQVYAFNASTGKQLWIADTGYEIYAAPAVANGVVYVASTDGYLYAFNAATGQLLWKVAAGGGNSSPALVDGVVYVGSTDNNLYALNAATGQQVWKQLTQSADSSPR